MTESSQETLTDILVRFVSRAGLGLLPVFILTGVSYGPDVGLAVGFGAGLILLSGIGLVILSGQLLDIDAGFSKGVAGFLLLGKFFALGALFWLGFSVLELAPVGLAGGMGLGVMGLVFSLLWGSSTKAAKAAIARSEKALAAEAEAQEKQDMNADSR